MSSRAVTLEEKLHKDFMQKAAVIEQGLQAWANRDEEIAREDEKDDLAVKLLEAVPYNDYGKWAAIRYRFLCWNYPEDVQEMIGAGEINEALEIIENEYDEKYRRMMAEQEKIHYDELYALTDIRQQAAMMRNWDMEVSEVLIRELSEYT